jgi:hypothetical protein
LSCKQSTISLVIFCSNFETNVSTFQYWYILIFYLFITYTHKIWLIIHNS